MSSTRKQCDFTKLIMHGYEVELNEGSTQDFFVTFVAPKDTIYEGAMYRVHVELPDQYPFASPSIGFEPYSIFHPNVDERSGSVCLDVINQTWTPLYSLINVFDVFLPQLLTYPNPADPLNGDAANLFCKDIKKYEEKVKAYVANSIKKYREWQRAKGLNRNAEDGIASNNEFSTSTPPSPTNNITVNDSVAVASNRGGSSMMSEGGDPADSNAEEDLECAEFELRNEENDEDLDAEFD